MSTPARRHDAGETLAWMVISCHLFEQRLQPCACSASPVLPTRDLSVSTARVHLSGHQRITSFLGHQGSIGTHGILANVEHCQARSGMLRILI